MGVKLRKVMRSNSTKYFQNTSIGCTIISDDRLWDTLDCCLHFLEKLGRKVGKNLLCLKKSVSESNANEFSRVNSKKCGILGHSSLDQKFQFVNSFFLKLQKKNLSKKNIWNKSFKNFKKIRKNFKNFFS